MLRSFVHSSAVIVIALVSTLQGKSRADELALPNVFGDHMVVQREQENPIWGKANPNAEVTILVSDRKATATADAEGNWKTMLPSLPTGGPFTIKITSGTTTKTISDVLSGEVWFCSGQSNMEWSVASSEDLELERISANYPNIRMINFPNVGSQTTVWTHDGDDHHWMVCNADTVPGFSAVGYFFGRQLHQTLNVPIGLVNDAWGGSAADAWIDQAALAGNDKFKNLMDSWKVKEDSYAALSARQDLNDEEKKTLADLKQAMNGNHRPGNIYHGILESHLGYGMRGMIWYQGESNAGRAYQYRELFPFMITHLREKWGKDFPFYWVQLADYRDETIEPTESAWAELREAQSMTLDRLPNVGEAVIIDIGEGKDIHPRNKVDVGRRLARLALKNDYGIKITANSPRYESMTIEGSAVLLTFKDIGGGWRAFDVNDPVGFTIAGEDKKFFVAKAAILDDKRIKVWSDSVTAPVAVRYGWANNPVVNMYNTSDLPLTPFRTDDWPGETINNFR
jgi:sialate O-acetylesterase